MTSVESETAADLQRWIARLSQAAQIGEPLGLAGSGSVDPADAHSWGPDRCIPAAALRRVLTVGKVVDPRGLRISGALFREELDLAHIAFPHPLHFKDCAFDSLADLRGAALKELSFEGCHTRHVKLEGAQISGDVFVGGMEADGAVDATGIQIGGQLVLHKARLCNAGGDALSLDNAEITCDVYAWGLEADGAVDATAVYIGGELDLDKARLRNADGDALDLHGAEITGDVFARSLEADGEVLAPGARFSGRLDLRGAKLRNRDGNALNLESASIKRLTFGPVKIADPLGPVGITGKVRLYRAEITDLETDANPPSPLVATGWEVTDIHGPLRSDWAAARRWLETTTKTSAQPWHALANVYERNGEPAGARRLRFAAARKVTRQSPVPTKILRGIYGAVVGYGYYPLLAGFWLLVIVVSSSLIVCANRADFVANNSATNSAAITYLQQTRTPVPTQTPLQPFSYTLSALLPTAVVNSTSDWTVRSDAAVLNGVLMLLKLSAWILTALLLAGVTGLLRKE
jgi:uncharacterized protein YjbI with pentapeptide repeats